MIYQALKTTVPTITLITCLALLAHTAGLESPFVYDDIPTIVQNSHIKELYRFQEKVGIENVLKRPVTLLSYAVNFELGRMNVFGYHLFNILLHVLTSITLFYTTQQLLTLEINRRVYHNKHLPHWTGTLFAVHPIATQSVTYLSNRSSILAAFFSLIAFYIFVRFVRHRSENGSLVGNIFFPILILMAFLLGCASKLTAVVFPVIATAFLLFRFPGSIKNIFRGAIFVIISFGIYIIYLYRSWLLESTIDLPPLYLPADASHGGSTPLTYFLTQLKVIVFNYGQKILWPINLNFEPDVSLTTGFMDTDWIVPGFILLFTGWIIYHTPSKVIKFGSLWILIAILPTSSLIPLKQLATEHRMYLPGIGVILVFCTCFQILGAWRRVSGFLFLGFLTLFILTTVDRQLDYQSAIHLWNDTIKKSPRKTFLYNNLATKLIEAGRLDEAEAMLNRALEQSPTHTLSHINFGNILYKQGRLHEAQKKYDAILQFGVRDKIVFYNSGLIRFDLGKPNEALPFFKKAVQLDSDFAPYHYSLGDTYQKIQRYDEALSEYKLALKYDPRHVGSMNNRGVIFLKLNQPRLAEKEFENAIALVKDLSVALNNLAGVRLLQERYEEALTLLDRYLNIHPDNTQVQEARDTIRLILGQRLP